MTSSDAHQSGLARYRAGLAERKRERMEFLEDLRRKATVEIRDGREFTVVRIPDKYGFSHRDRS